MLKSTKDARPPGAVSKTGSKEMAEDTGKLGVVNALFLMFSDAREPAFLMFGVGRARGSMEGPLLDFIQEGRCRDWNGRPTLAGIPGPKHKGGAQVFDDLLYRAMAVLPRVFE